MGAEAREFTGYITTRITLPAMNFRCHSQILVPTYRRVTKVRYLTYFLFPENKMVRLGDVTSYALNRIVMNSERIGFNGGSALEIQCELSDRHSTPRLDIRSNPLH